MTLPIKFRKQRTRTLISHNFSDFTNGLGYVEFFMFETKDSVGAKFSILNKALKVSSTHLITPSSTEFTTTFGITQRMEGKVLFQVHWGFRMNGNSGTGNIVLSLEKNGVEIATVTGEDLTSTTNTERTEIIEINVPNTVFGPGDILKVKITIAFDPSNLVNDGYWLAIDPKDTSFTPGGGWSGGSISDTVFKTNIPFIIDI